MSSAKRPRPNEGTKAGRDLSTEPVHENCDRSNHGRHFFAEFIETLARRRDYAALKANYPELADCSEDFIRRNADRAWREIQRTVSPGESFTDEHYSSIIRELKSCPYWNPFLPPHKQTNYLEAFGYPLQNDTWFDDFLVSIGTSMKQGKNMASICQGGFCGKSRLLKETLNHVIGFYFNFDPANDIYPWSVPKFTEKMIDKYLRTPKAMYRGLLYVLREWLDSRSLEFSTYHQLVTAWNGYQSSDPFFDNIARVIEDYAFNEEVDNVIRAFEHIDSEDVLLRNEFGQTIAMLRNWKDGSTRKPDGLDILFVFDEASAMANIIGYSKESWQGYKEVLDPLKEQLSVFIIIEGSWGPQLYSGLHKPNHNVDPYNDISLEHPIHKTFPQQSVALFPKVPMDVWPACKVLRHKLRDILTTEYMSIFGRPAWHILCTNTPSSPFEVKREIMEWLFCHSLWTGAEGYKPAEAPIAAACIFWRISATIPKAKRSAVLIAKKLLICDGASDDFETLSILQTQEPIVAEEAKNRMPKWKDVFYVLAWNNHWFASRGNMDVSMPGQLFLLVVLDAISSTLKVYLYETPKPIEAKQFMTQLLEKQLLFKIGSQITWPIRKPARTLDSIFEHKIMRVTSFFDFKGSDEVTGEFLLDLFNRAVGSFNDGKVDIPMVSLPPNLNTSDEILDFNLTPACMSYITIKFVRFEEPADMAQYIAIAEATLRYTLTRIMPVMVVVLDLAETTEQLVHRVQRKKIDILVLRGITSHAFLNSGHYKTKKAEDNFQSSVRRCRVTSI